MDEDDILVMLRFVFLYVTGAYPDDKVLLDAYERWEVTKHGPAVKSGRLGAWKNNR